MKAAAVQNANVHNEAMTFDGAPTYAFGSNNKFQAIRSFSSAFVNDPTLSGTQGTQVTATQFATALKNAGADTLYYAYVSYTNNAGQNHWLTSNDVKADGTLNSNVYTDVDGAATGATLTVFRAQADTPTKVANNTFTGDTIPAANTDNKLFTDADAHTIIAADSFNASINYIPNTDARTFTIAQNSTPASYTLSDFYTQGNNVTVH